MFELQIIYLNYILFQISSEAEMTSCNATILNKPIVTTK